MKIERIVADYEITPAYEGPAKVYFATSARVKIVLRRRAIAMIDSIAQIHLLCAQTRCFVELLNWIFL
jgi:hypothetical protein